MDKKTILISIVIIAIGVLLGSLGLAWVNRAAPSVGSAGSNFMALMSTSSASSISAGDTAVFFATSTARCSARAITISAGEIRITFGEYASTSIPSATNGHLQQASTTPEKVYDGGLYGCGTWKVWSSGAANFTVSEF